MAPAALVNATIWVAGHDFSGDSNKLTLSAESEALDATTFASAGWKENRGGLKQIAASLEGFWSSAASDSVDSDVFSVLGQAGEVMTASPTGTALDPAYLVQVAKLKYEIFGEIGKLAPFKLDMSGSNNVGLVRGQITKGRGTVSGTGAIGSPVQLGAVGASQYLYGAVHLLGTPGTSITLKVQSDNATGFPSATDVVTVGPLTAAGGTWVTRTAGAITDDWFRLNVSAITGTWIVAGALGIAA